MNAMEMAKTAIESWGCTVVKHPKTGHINVVNPEGHTLRMTLSSEALDDVQAEFGGTVEIEAASKWLKAVMKELLTREQSKVA